MSVGHWNLHLIPFLAILVFLNNLEISGHMIQYDRQGQPVHLPRRHNPQRRHRNNRPSSPQTTTTTEEPIEYEAEEGVSTTSSYLYDYPTKRLGYGYNAYNTYDYQYTDPNGHGGGYDYGYGTTVEMEEQVTTTQTPRRAVITPVSVRTTVRNETQVMMQSDQGSHQSSAESGNGGSKPGGSENEYSGSPRPEGSQRTVSASNSASQNKGGQSNGTVSQQASNEQVKSGQVVDSTQNTQRNTPPSKPPPNGTSGKRDIHRGNSKGNQQDRVILPGRNAERRRGRPRQPTTSEPLDYEHTPLTMTKTCSCMSFCPYGTFYMGPCRGVISWVSSQRRRTCCMHTEPLMRYLLPLALLQNLLAEI